MRKSAKVSAHVPIKELPSNVIALLVMSWDKIFLYRYNSNILYLDVLIIKLVKFKTKVYI